MSEYVSGGFLAGVLFGVAARISWNMTFVCSVGLLGYGIGTQGGPREYVAFLWDVDTLAIWAGFIVGFCLGYLAVDRAALWLLSS